jgi:hypothetical protein
MLLLLPLLCCLPCVVCRDTAGKDCPVHHHHHLDRVNSYAAAHQGTSTTSAATVQLSERLDLAAKQHCNRCQWQWQPNSVGLGLWGQAVVQMSRPVRK